MRDSSMIPTKVGAFKLMVLSMVMVSGLTEHGGARPQKPDTSLRGVVVTEDDRQVAEASVGLDGTTYQTTTNKQGKFTLRGFPYGTYTVVAAKPGFLAAGQFNLEITKEHKQATTRLVLKPDPDYTPNSVKIVDITPTPESVLTPGKDVSIRFRVQYSLSSDPYATVAVSYQDDQGRALMPMPSQVTISNEKGFVNFGQTIRAPNRMNGKIQVIVAMFTGSATRSNTTDTVTYYVRPFTDQVKVSDIALTAGSAWEKGKDTSITTTVDYLLKSFASADVRIQARADLGNGRFEVLLIQVSHSVEKSKGEKGTFNFQPTFTIPQNATAIRVRAEMVPKEMKDPLVIQWSKPCATDKKPGE